MHGSYTSHFIRQSNNRSFKTDLLSQLRRLIVRANQSGQIVTITTWYNNVVSVNNPYMFSGKLMFHHGDKDTGETKYRDNDSGFPIPDSIQPDTKGYYEVYEQVKQYL